MSSELPGYLEPQSSTETQAARRQPTSSNMLPNASSASADPVSGGHTHHSFQELLQPYLQRFQPAGPIEHQLVSDLASIDWRLSRISAAACSPGYDILSGSFFRRQRSLIRARRTVLATLVTLRKILPAPDRTRIPSRNNNIPSQTNVRSDSPGRKTNSPRPRTNSIELAPAPHP